METLNKNSCVNGSIKKKCSGLKEFKKQAVRELEKVKETGNRVTFLLIKPHLKKDDNIDHYLAKLYQLINNGLRDCDSVFMYPPDRFVVILPHTHEGGGESAALRLKKNIAKLARENGESIASDVGVVSVGPEQDTTLEDLMEELEKDLSRDQRCHSIITSDEHKKLLVLIGFDEKIHKKIQARFGYLYNVLSSLSEDLLSTDNDDLINSNLEIAIINLTQAAGHNSDSDGLIKRLSEENFSKMEVTLDPPDPDSSNLKVAIFTRISLQSQDVFMDVLGMITSSSRRMSADEKKKYKDVLSSIGSFTHQVNQPLQIIMGKVELMLLDLDLQGFQDMPEEIKDTLRQIKEQVHYIAEINQKINRLTKL